MTIYVIEFEDVIFTGFETVEYHRSFGSRWSQKLMIYISFLDVMVVVVMTVAMAMIIMTVVTMVSVVVVAVIIMSSTSERSDWSSE